MNIQTSWDNQRKQIIRWDFGTTWDLEAFFQANLETIEMVASVRHQVDIIVNFENSSYLPTNILPNAARFLRSLPSNLGVIVVAGSGRFAMPAANLFTKLYDPLGKDVCLANSLEQARLLISTERECAA